VTGPGGVGKTRLAIEAARSAAPSFEAGIWLVDLAAVADGSLVPGAVLSTLGADRRPEGAGASSDTTDEDGALARLAMRLSHRPALILLDNCEHVITACARVASRLLTASDGAHILATSREPLAIDGEAVFPLDPMPLGDPSSGAESLFVERARRHDVSFEPDAPEAIGEICRLTDGLPLAIELAAAHVRALSCQEIARRLGSDRFTLLRSGSRTAADRQRTLEAAVDWGYELLSEPEQMLLPRLAVFPSDFTLEAAEAVCSGDGLEAAGILDLLSGLVDRSFVTRTVRAGRTRYWMLETIRQYGWRRVEASDAVTPRRVLFRKEGDTWAIGPADHPVRLRDGKGLRHVAVLLSAPGREHHVLDLQGAPAALDRDAGEMLDPSARAAYKARIIELGEEAEDALALNDLDRASQATAERDRLLEELARATGLGGRSRRVGSGAERARAAVTKAIRRAIADIAEHDRELGEHLSRAVSTGTFCRYEGGMEWTL
jgi:predicted ATPase